MSGLVLEDLCAGYGATQVLHEISARIEPGELVVLVGANASGKTTLVRVLAGLQVHSGGRIVWPGSASTHRQRPIGLAITPDALPAGLSGFHAIDLVKSALKTTAVDAALDYARAVELYPLLGRAISGYSLGTRQKLAIALALIGDSPLLLLDESLNGLDLVSVGRTLDNLYSRTRASGQSVMLVTHNIDLAQAYAQRVWLLEQGRLVREWGTDELTRMQRERELISRQIMQHLSKN